MRRNVSDILIHQANNEGWIKSLAYFYALKHHCSHGFFRGYEELSRRTGFGKGAIHKHVTILRKKGLIKGKTFLTSAEIRAKYKCKRIYTIIIKSNDTLLQIENMLLGKLVEIYLSKQEHCIREARLKDTCSRARKGFEKRWSNPKQRARVLRYKILQDNVAFDYKHIAEWLGLSIKKAWTMMKECKERGMCSVKTHTIDVANMSHDTYKKVRKELSQIHTNHRWQNGKVKVNVFSIFKQNRYWELGHAV
jgi:DNA-binding Lrp family transcriptional regulator